MGGAASLLVQDLDVILLPGLHRYSRTFLSRDGIEVAIALDAFGVSDPLLLELPIIAAEPELATIIPSDPERVAACFRNGDRATEPLPKIVRHADSRGV